MDAPVDVELSVVFASDVSVVVLKGPSHSSEDASQVSPHHPSTHVHFMSPSNLVRVNPFYAFISYYNLYSLHRFRKIEIKANIPVFSSILQAPPFLQGSE